MFSDRGGFAREPNALTVALEHRRAIGSAPLDLTLSNPTRAGIEALADPEWLALAATTATLYEPEPFGLATAREAVSRWMAAHAVALVPEHVVLTASTSEAYALLLKLLCDPGDDVLVPEPSYPLLEHLCRLESVHARAYALRYDGGWQLPIDELARMVGPRTRAIVLVSPNNPTGSFTKRAELAALAELGLPIVSDEVFALYPHREDPERTPSALAATRVLVFSLFGLSKLAALPQLKLSWIGVRGPSVVADEALARLEIIADAFLSVATPVQLALPAILSRHAPVTDAIRARLRTNLGALRALVAGTPVDLLDLEGGWYATLRLPATRDDEAWALGLLDEAGVLVQPGFLYDFHGGPYAVLSLLAPTADFSDGTARLVRYVRERA